MAAGAAADGSVVPEEIIITNCQLSIDLLILRNEPHLAWHSAFWPQAFSHGDRQLKSKQALSRGHSLSLIHSPGHTAEVSTKSSQSM